MRRFFLTSVASVGLALATLPALAQILPNPVSATPPIAAPQPEANVTADAQVEPTAPLTPPVAAEATTSDAAASAVVAPPTATAQVQTPAGQLSATGATPTPTSAASVCQPRVTSVHFGARGSSLSQQNRNALEYAADAASVCDLQAVTIVDSSTGRTSSRRTSAVREALVRQGVSADRISVDNTGAAADAASTGRLDVRMQFAGVADAGTPVADASGTSRAMPPAPTGPAPDATPPTPASPVTPPQEPDADVAQPAPPSM